MTITKPNQETWSSRNDSKVAKEKFHIWPLDVENVRLLNEVHPKSWKENEEEVVYDLIAVGAGAGGLVSSRQAARRGAKSAMISAKLAGGDCLNVGCVPSKALIRCAKMIREVRKAQNDSTFGVQIGGQVEVDFPQIMNRMRSLRAMIAPIDGHDKGKEIGVNIFQGFGRFIDENTIEVVQEHNKTRKLKFKKVAICTGGRASIPSIPGLKDAPYTTNETLFNLTKLPTAMTIIGSGVVALEMAQCFATFGSKVTVLVRSDKLFRSLDPEAGPTIQSCLEKIGVEFVKYARVAKVETLRNSSDDEGILPLMRVKIISHGEEIELETDCLLVAAGRTPNVEKLNLDAAKVAYDPKEGILVDEYARSTSNPNVYSVGDCTAGVPRLTHMSGEMAKVVVQNALFNGKWNLNDLVVPATMYTEPEFASVGTVTGDNLDTYTTSLEHNDRSILDSEREGYVKIFCKKGSGKIIGCSIIGSRAGEIINEVSLAIKYGITLEEIGRNIHCYPTTGEAVMLCGLQLINSKWDTL